VISRAENLPTLPAAALEALRLSQDDNATIDDLAAALARDPALAAKLLRLANSTLFNPGGRAVTSLQKATMLLGTKTVKLMALSFSLADTLPKRGRGRFDFPQYWRRSLITAVAARRFAALVKATCGDEAFLCGLLAHIGQLVISQCLPEEYDRVIERSGGWPSIEHERALLGFDRSDVAGALLGDWGFPAVLVNALREMHVPSAARRAEDSEQEALACLLRFAGLATEVLCSESKGAALRDLMVGLRERYGLASKPVDEALVALEAEVVEAASLLSLDLPPGQSHEKLLDDARHQIVAISLGTAADLKREQDRAHELESRNQVLSEAAEGDKLTGLFNRARFDQEMAAQIESRSRDGRAKALGLLMIDVDHFKKFNDDFGHQNGDKVLRLIGFVLKKSMPPADLAFRYGGEEFAVVMPEVTPAELSAVGERLRAAIASQVLDLDGSMAQVTASFGGACLARASDAKSGAALIKAADDNLYRAKQLGRNRVVIGAAAG
jgi:diguanylate cyclase (GGDEF)-like protein